MLQIAIIGGGPGGLMTAWHLKNKIGKDAEVTLFEASHRLGGKIQSKSFSKGGLYEAGVAEIYDYTALGSDPLKQLITGTLGLKTVPMDSDTIVQGDHIMHGIDGIEKALGKKTRKEVEAFRKKCADLISPEAYYEGAGKDDNDHPWLYRSGQEILEEEIHDDAARRLIRTAAHSDIATAPHLTSGLNSLKNFLMDVEGYIGLYSVVGGVEGITKGLAERITANIRLNTRVRRVAKQGEQYALTLQNGAKESTELFDIVCVCLPHNWLSTMEWGDGALQSAMAKHVGYFDYPAHYLRITIQFETPFWKDHFKDSWFMSDAFNGCCVYDESSRHTDYNGRGALGWLIAGNDAQAYCNLTDEQLLEVALDSLPAGLQFGRNQVVETKIHRWMSTVNGIPGGRPVRDALTNHIPERKEAPGVFVVGDYMFDATLNGVLDSADCATDLILAQLMLRRYQTGNDNLFFGKKNERFAPPSARIDKAYFDHYRLSGTYAEAWDKFFDVDYLLDTIAMVWPNLKGKNGKPLRILDAGSASGLTVQALRARGIDAWGIENNRYIHSQTPEEMKKYNLFGTILDLPFKDDEFDIVIESALCHIGPSRIPDAIDEMYRVCKTGLIFQSITADLTTEVVENFELLRGVKKISTWWEWSELLMNGGFEIACESDELLAKIYARTLEAKRGPGDWYEDEESLRYCFYTKH